MGSSQTYIVQADSYLGQGGQSAHIENNQHGVEMDYKNEKLTK